MTADARRVLSLVAPYAIALAAGTWWLPLWVFPLGLSAGLAITLGVIFDQFHRLSRRSKESFRQLEASTALYASVQPRLPLPPMRDWAMSPDMAGLVFATVMQRKPRIVVELGSGVSTLVTGYALERLGAGRVISLDHDADFAETSRRAVKHHGLERWVDVHHAPLQHRECEGKSGSWYDTSTLDAIDRIDVLVVDGPTQAGVETPMVRFPALPALFEKLADDVIILVDDASRRDEDLMVKEWAKLYPEFAVRHLPTETGTTILERRPE